MEAYRITYRNNTVLVTEKELYFSFIPNFSLQLEEGQFEKILESSKKNEEVKIEKMV